MEAIQLISGLDSFRSTRNDQLIRKGSNRSSVSAVVEGNGRSLNIVMTVEGTKRSYSLNGKKKTRSTLLGMLPSVTFTPDDLDLVKGSHSIKRAALDNLGSQMSKNYYAVKKDYDTLVKQKNRALKEEESQDYIDSIDEVLVKAAAQLMVYRETVLVKIEPIFIETYKVIAQEEESVAIRYLPSWMEEGSKNEKIFPPASRADIEEALWTQLGRLREEERRRQHSVVGPHTDHIIFLLSGSDAVHFASQGQQRSMVLAYKIAELRVLEDSLKQKPLLLLDDVMSELDERRRKAFVSLVAGDIQTFITTTNLDYFDPSFLQKSQVVSLVKEGGCR